MQDLYFDSSTHSYYYKGEKKPCVSDVLKMVDVIALEGIPQKNLETAAERGTRVHEQTELLEVGLADRDDEDWRDENYDILGYIDAYENFLIEHEELPIALEESVYSEEYDLAGTIADNHRSVFVPFAEFSDITAVSKHQTFSFLARN